jgi:cell division protein ZapA (FtsZ GTPase activity inhibitor)
MENKRLTIMLAVLLVLELIQVIEKIVELVMR